MYLNGSIFVRHNLIPINEKEVFHMSSLNQLY